MIPITSAQNPRIKHLLALQQKSALRREEGLFVVEGRRELEHCIQAGMQVHSIFCLNPDEVTSYLSSIISHLSSLNSKLSTLNWNLTQVSDSVYSRIAYRGSTEGIIAVIRTPQPRTLQSLIQQQGRGVNGKPLFIILESVEKPGNLGAILRSADAANATGVIVCDPLTDLFNPNLIRSSIGAVFTVPTVACTSAECISFLKQNGIQILTAQLQDSHLYYDTPMSGPTAIVMGTESTGLTDVWRQAADAHIRIPMLGQLDSLNVSVSAAILLFEAVRQRQI
ncbi:MAG: RNA methyltransferase [Bacteroidaceae bacterium]|nr:RNA methyltransferase [Bacteroidaceae bacterium]